MHRLVLFSSICVTFSLALSRNSFDSVTVTQHLQIVTSRNFFHSVTVIQHLLQYDSLMMERISQRDCHVTPSTARPSIQKEGQNWEPVIGKTQIGRHRNNCASSAGSQKDRLKNKQNNCLHTRVSQGSLSPCSLQKCVLPSFPLLLRNCSLLYYGRTLPPCPPKKYRKKL